MTLSVVTIDDYKDSSGESPDELLDRARGQFKDLLIIGHSSKDDYLTTMSTQLSRSEVSWMLENLRCVYLRNNNE